MSANRPDIDPNARLETLRPLFEHRQAVRLAHHQPAGLTIDTYAGHLLLTDYRGRADDDLQSIAQPWLDALRSADLPAIGATAKRRPDNLSHHQPDSAPVTLVGDAPPARFVVREFDWQLEVGFVDSGFATGVFLDAALARKQVHDFAEGRRVLNLFSYTGAFSIAAAAGGATEIIEVDTAKKWLTWAQANQQLNQVTCVRQRRNDAVSFLQRQNDRSFDLIIVDPPNYANPKKGPRFTIEKGYGLMSPHLRRALSPGGYVIAMCNHAQTHAKQFRRWLPRELTFEQWINTPPDFGGADYLKIALLRA